MAHIVGVPKREPCQQCGNPVFFAERLPIGRFLYHRTCLKCARCGSQLSPGSFYETEHDGVFCCETCPDEEPKIQLDIKNADRKSPSPSQSSLSSETPLEANRQSFSEKLVMFQTDGKGLLQKSMSDEEKSKSLKRLSVLNELLGKNSMLESATSAMAIEESGSEIDPVKSVSALEIGERRNGVHLESASDGSDDDEDLMVPPMLPKTQPPSPDESKPKFPPIPSKVNVLNKLKMHSSPMKTTRQSGDEHQSHQLNPSIMVKNDQSSQIETFKNIESTLPSHNTNIATPIGENSTEEEKEQKILSIENDITTNGLAFDALNSSIDVTKETTKNDTRTEDVNHTANCIDSTKTATSNDIDEVPSSTNGKCQQDEPDEPKVDSGIDYNENKQSISIDTKTNISNGNEKHSVNESDNDASVIDDARIGNSTGNAQNNSNNQMVRSRLSQFEAILQSESTRQTPSHKYNNSSPRFESNSSIANTMEIGIKPHLEHEHEHNRGQTNEICEETKANAIHEQIERNALMLDTASNENDSSLAIDNNNVNFEQSNKKPTPLKRNTKIVCQIDNDSSLSPAPVKRRNRVNATENVRSIEEPSKEIDQVNEAIGFVSIEKDHKMTAIEYPGDLNPFGSDDEDAAKIEEKPEIEHEAKRRDSLNPFDSSDDEVELLKKTSTQKQTCHNFRISTNPFGSESEDENDTDSVSSKRTPVPTPRKPLNGSSLHSTPEPSPRMSQTLNPRMRLTSKLNDDMYGSSASIASSSNSPRVTNTLNRFSQVHGSMNSLASSSPRHKKGRAPSIPAPKSSISANSSPSHSTRATPMSRKKRAAPLPPKPPTTAIDSKTFDIHKAATLKLGDTIDPNQHHLHESSLSNESIEFDSSFNIDTSSIESPYISTTSDSPMMSNESVASEIPTETKPEPVSIKLDDAYEAIGASKALEPRDSQRKLIPVDSSLLDDFTIRNIAERPGDENITYRRKIIPDLIVTPDQITDRQCEKMKENKESQNKNRQSQVVLPIHASSYDDSNQLYSPNKSSFGKWKRRKGPAPSLPIPPRKVIQMLPLQEIRHELEVIEVQQLGLEKQGVILEKMIRERCEGTENENKPLDEFKPNTKEVEDLILQLFELVNEKNELFRRQAELMYLRRQHRLEQEQADIEYEIRVLMAQPECNKTDSDKAREEALISRLVKVVQLRNEVIESLEMDRIREAEEDQSIKERLELHTAKLDEELLTPTKLSKKEKKKQKESKKLAKQKKLDTDKDADESEIGELNKSAEKKKKKKFLF